MTTSHTPAPMSAEDLRRRADKERVFGAFQDAFDDLASTKAGRLELRIMFAKANIDRDQAADLLDALSSRVAEMEAEHKRLTSCEDEDHDPCIAFLLRGANDALARATQAIAERDAAQAALAAAEAREAALRDYITATEYWKLEPHDDNERKAYLAALSAGAQQAQGETTGTEG
ncbi:hypothetical protein Sp245p_26385 (plasmid) [Azospirillum baldaniorum]|uniref:Uncharacterized protein n=1 Tax=Azospirillum baldaniorum TaxID=1064539 RepID=A0A9P1JZZ9_9PROT|nr:hypothetical protein [Azospirillum baldaniorum]AWJ93254.1 hypothetical protein Sp245p_25870 [Azospirillum baldaniorum]AWJ93352.1 hypothetical protein Sp245p_26385 [Azospirillum baldaniorum]TWA77948.1 hypothetical protein FBZ85_106108 [Azospirillum brasilense]CCD02952.1 protein of unknown function [Azospirillum baldaniorum]